MHAHSAKQEVIEVIEAIQRLPDTVDTVDTEEIMYHLYVLENVRRGQQNVQEGKSTPTEQVLSDIQT